MLKKLFSMLIILTLIFSVVGCSKEEVKEQENQVKQEDQSPKIEFDTVTVYGDKINSDIFGEKKLTMVNIWATFCSPCIDEIPEIQELFKELIDENIDANIMGIVADTPSEENEIIAREIIENNNVEYLNLIPDMKLVDGLLKEVSAVPTTIFVDNNGKIVGEVIIGARSKDSYKEEILNRLDTLD